MLNALPVSRGHLGCRRKILLANPQAQKEIGGDTPVAGNHTDVFYAKENNARRFSPSCSGRKKVVMHEVPYRSSRGEIIEGILSAPPITYNDEPAVLGVVVNITERRNMERSWRERRSIEEASRFKGQFLANMSHEIRTPMNAIVGLGHLLSRTSLTPQAAGLSGKIQISAHALLTIIDDILDFSKIEAGQLRIERIDFDIDEVLDNITACRNASGRKPVEFIYDIDPDVPSRLHGDPHRSHTNSHQPGGQRNQVHQ